MMNDIDKKYIDTVVYRCFEKLSCMLLFVFDSGGSLNVEIYYQFSLSQLNDS